jgi:hypothetical protein
VSPTRIPRPFDNRAQVDWEEQLSPILRAVDGGRLHLGTPQALQGLVGVAGISRSPGCNHPGGIAQRDSRPMRRLRLSGGTCSLILAEFLTPPFFHHSRSTPPPTMPRARSPSSPPPRSPEGYNYPHPRRDPRYTPSPPPLRELGKFSPGYVHYSRHNSRSPPRYHHSRGSSSRRRHSRRTPSPPHASGPQPQHRRRDSPIGDTRYDSRQILRQLTERPPIPPIFTSVVTPSGLAATVHDVERVRCDDCIQWLRHMGGCQIDLDE